MFREGDARGTFFTESSWTKDQNKLSMKFLKGRIESTNEFKECLLSLQHSTQQKSLLWLCRLCIVCPLPRRLTSTQRKSKSAFFGGEKRPAAMSNRNSSCLTFSNVVNLNPMTVNLWNEHVNHCQPPESSCNLFRKFGGPEG